MVYYHNEISNVLYEIKNDKKKKKKQIRKHKY